MHDAGTNIILFVCILGLDRCTVSRPPYCSSFEITLSRTPPDGWSACRRELYLTTHNNHKRYTPMSPAEFEPANPVSERPQTHALDRPATGIGPLRLRNLLNTQLSCGMTQKTEGSCVFRWTALKFNFTNTTGKRPKFLFRLHVIWAQSLLRIIRCDAQSNCCHRQTLPHTQGNTRLRETDKREHRVQNILFILSA